MSVVSKRSATFVWMDKKPPTFCNGCSQRLPDPPGRFVHWSFLGPELTKDGKALHVSADPDTIEEAMRLERLAERLGDASAEGPEINLCYDCALYIGSNLIEDAAILRHDFMGRGVRIRENEDAFARQMQQDAADAEQGTP